MVFQLDTLFQIALLLILRKIIYTNLKQEKIINNINKYDIIFYNVNISIIYK